MRLVYDYSKGGEKVSAFGDMQKGTNGQVHETFDLPTDSQRGFVLATVSTEIYKNIDDDLQNDLRSNFKLELAL